ncbi:hypothetical protein OE699_11055 [Sedimentimonas flavescens]|uniref:Uncharacterized protein n=1 Tax=Sedimentimonas flavescens TaxID=2851012 RepID=A0ABT3A0D8_9RHOB|nr:hypothetical protein [Sedimentimonas flavescens]MCV2879396.1 hypothetical protein [Sedimentimonas flavescens]
MNWNGTSNAMGFGEELGLPSLALATLVIASLTRNICKRSAGRSGDPFRGSARLRHGFARLWRAQRSTYQRAACRVGARDFHRWKPASQAQVTPRLPLAVLPGLQTLEAIRLRLKIERKAGHGTSS